MTHIVVAGIPNAGKTTLYNALTGSQAKVANYPGVTVEHRIASVTLPDGTQATCTDIPGCYSLTSRSRDEQTAYEILTGTEGKPPPDRVLCVLDAYNLSRSLYLLFQLMELRLPLVAALNMTDVAEEHGYQVDVDKLQQCLGIPIVPTIASKGQGIDELRSALTQTAAYGQHTVDDLEKARPQDESDARALIRARYACVDTVMLEVQQSVAKPQVTWNERLDRTFLHPVAGPLLFVLIIGTTFQAIFSWATPFMDTIESGVAWLGDGVTHVLPAGLLQSLVVHGIITGVGNVLVFLPQIAFLFLVLAVLEQSGYMARAAVLLDGVMRRVGLHGKAFVPLLSSFACAVPGIMAARTVESPKDRLVTILIAPFMTCSARLPVFVLVISAVFTHQAPVAGVLNIGGLLLTSMYLMGFVAAIATAWLLKHTVLRAPLPVLLLELPPYKRPQLKAVARTVFTRSKVFVTQTGPIIIVLSMVLWSALTFPRLEPQDLEHLPSRAEAVEARALEHSIAGRVGHFLEPALEPLGFDWRIGVGLVASFAAREVLVSTLAQVHALDPSIDAESPSLRAALLSDIDPNTGKPRFTPLVGMSLMVFFVLALQCMSTVATVKRETNSWKWPALQLLYMNGVAYLMSLLVFQVGTVLGWG